MKNFDTIPTIGVYRGVSLHDQQSPARLDVVRRAIDDVYAQHKHSRLLEIAGDTGWPPEARLFAAAKLKAVHELAAHDREKRPAIDVTFVNAITAGLNSQQWRHPRYFASLLDPGPAQGMSWVEREQPLTDRTRGLCG